MEVIRTFLIKDFDVERLGIDVLDLLHERISNEKDLTVVQSGVDFEIGKSDKMIGYYPPYGVAYLSSPENRDAIFAVDPKNKELIVDFAGGAFYADRDAVVYSKIERLEIESNFGELLTHFIRNGYKIKKFRPTDIGRFLILFKNAEEIPRDSEIVNIDIALEILSKPSLQ